MGKSIGIDIDAKYIRVVELESVKKSWKVITYGAISSPISQPVIDSKDDIKETSGRIKQLLKEVRVSSKNINTALPESQAFTQVITTPLLSQKEMDSAMKWQAEQYVPLPLEDVSFGYNILNKDSANNSMQVLISAAPLNLIEKYNELIRAAGLNPQHVETRILSSIRALSRNTPDDYVSAVIELGEYSSDFAFFTNSNILFTHSISTGGRAITRAISQEFNLNSQQADRYKVTYGVDPSQLDGKVYNAIKPLIDQFIHELNNGFIYFRDQYPNHQVNLVFLTGEGALMPGIVKLIAEQFGVEVQRGDPFAGLTFAKGVDAPSASASAFTTAVGLAIL